MPRHKSEDLKKKICETALRLAAKEGWKNLTLSHLAKAAKVPDVELQAQFADKHQLLAALIEEFDRRTAKAAARISPKEPLKDRLFEVLMARFDQLQIDREGVLSIFRDERGDPLSVRYVLPAQIKTMRQIMHLAHLTPTRGHAAFIVSGLLGVYYRTLFEWEKDESHDMRKTMAVLDRSLKCAGKAAELFFRSPK